MFSSMFSHKGGFFMQTVGYYNGTLAPLDELMIPATDRALYFGDGCYDATTFKNNVAFALEDHLDRFYNSCRLLEIKFPLTRSELKDKLYQVIDANESDTGMLYWQTSRGSGLRNHLFPEDSQPNLLIFTAPFGLVPFDAEFKLISREDTRFLHCNIKTLNLLPNVIASQRAKEAGCQEVVFHRGERVTECGHSNILILKDGVLCTPPRDNLILPGITLKHLLELAKENNIPTSEAPFTMDDLRAADEVIVSSSACLGIRAVELDGQPVGGKDLATLQVLQQAYAKKYEADVQSR